MAYTAMSRLLNSGNTAVQVSLRELLLLVLLAGISLAGLVAGPPFAWFGVFVHFSILTGCLITALTAVGSYRAFAIGAVVPAMIYGAAVLTASDYELRCHAGTLPTSRAFQAMVQPTEVKYRQASTEQAVEKQWNALSVMPLGHLFAAAILGYAGAKFAVLVHCRSRRTT